MKKNQLMRTITTVALVATMAFTLVACGSDSSADSSAQAEQEVGITEPGEIIEAGYGDNFVELTVVINTGESFGFELSTEQETVGDAIEVEGMAVLAEDGTVAAALGLEPADGANWNFYVDGKLSSTNVKETTIVEGATYALIYE